MDYSSALAAAIECAEDVPEAIEAPESIVADDGDDQAEDDGIRNLPALNHVTNQIRLPDEYPWAETLVITHNKAIDVDAEDDLKREVQFYEFTVNAVKQAVTRLNQIGVPYQRPADFFAEMVKSDDHMARIKRKLLHESAAIAQVAENKRVASQKKFAKQVNAEKQQEKALAKKTSVEAINAWKKEAKSNKLTEESFDAAMALAEKQVKKWKKSKAKHAEPKVSHKRQRKNEKFGIGSRNRTGKRNDLTQDDKPKKHTGKKQRPGKRRRLMSTGKSK